MMTVFYCFVNYTALYILHYIYCAIYTALYIDHETYNVEDRQQLQSGFKIFTG